MIRRLLALFSARWCNTHGRYDSDFCGPCLKVRLSREERSDRRPEWTKAQGQWPIKRKDVA
jgi:hypothetical protein